MHLSRVLACVLLPNVGIAAACAARDKSVADFRAPVPAPVPVTPPAMATARAPNTPVAQLPPKIVFAASRVSISRDGANYLFRLAEAPMPEIIAAVAALFRVRAIYAGSGSRVVSGDFSAQSIEQVLAWLSDGSSLRYTAEGGRWVIREMSDAVPPVPMMSLASVLTFAAPASPEIAGESMTTSAARAGR